MGFTPLHVAASQGCKGILDSMIHHGAALNKQSKVYLRYVWSIFNNHPSPGIGLQHGNTPLHLACQNNEVETVEILINKGVDLNCLNSVRTTVFVDETHFYTFARDTFRFYLFQRLQSPIHIAAEMGHTDICELLLAAGANIEQREQVNTDTIRFW